MTEMKFFVYGSMSEGHVHFDKIREFIKKKEMATIFATAYRLQVGYPVVLEEGEDPIPGWVMSYDENNLLLNLLDQFHGIDNYNPSKNAYYRKEVLVKTIDGELPALVYFFNAQQLPKNAQKIEDGNWLRSIEEKPTLTSVLSERQKEYILKLGRVTGREIVPINDLSLYRELMNLELIVDKGRRLALSKLGYEVYRYLG